VSAGTGLVTIVDDDAAGAVGAVLTVLTGKGSENSTYPSRSMTLRNTSTSGSPSASIVSARLELATGILPDVRFDPTGAYGDSDGKPITIDGGAATTGFVAPGDPLTDPYDSYVEGGPTAVELHFTDFDPGELLRFSGDIAPSSIIGVPFDWAGHLGGMELAGAVASVVFSNGDRVEAPLQNDPEPGWGSAGVVATGLPAAPALAVPGVALEATAFSNGARAAMVGAGPHTVRISGPEGASVRLLRMEARLSVPPATGGYDLEPFEANLAGAYSIIPATIGPGGTVDVEVTLGTAHGGLHHLMAYVSGAGGAAGWPSGIVVLQVG
jgi:large repetitive protein